MFLFSFCFFQPIYNINSWVDYCHQSEDSGASGFGKKGSIFIQLECKIVKCVCFQHVGGLMCMSCALVLPSNVGVRALLRPHIRPHGPGAISATLGGCDHHVVRWFWQQRARRAHNFPEPEDQYSSVRSSALSARKILFNDNLVDSLCSRRECNAASLTLRVKKPEGGADVISASEALERARSLGLDVVLVNGEIDIPVVQLVNAKDHITNTIDRERKKKKRAKAQSKKQAVKELRIGPNIGANDLQTKIRRARSWLRSGTSVRFTFTSKQGAGLTLQESAKSAV